MATRRYVSRRRSTTDRLPFLFIHAPIVCCSVHVFPFCQVRGSREFEYQRELLSQRSQRGALRGFSIKKIKTAPNQAESATLEFKFRISSEGIKPEEEVADQEITL